MYLSDGKPEVPAVPEETCFLITNFLLTGFVGREVTGCSEARG
jgi:hypothetical protein